MPPQGDDMFDPLPSPPTHAPSGFEANEEQSAEEVEPQEEEEKA